MSLRSPTVYNHAKRLSVWECNYCKHQEKYANEMSDTFHKSIPDSDIDRMLSIMGKYPRHTYIILTKRIERAVSFFEGCKLPPNIWIGTSIESEKYLKRLDELRKIDAVVRFVSFEPLLGYVMNFNLKGIQWVIVGGESDPKPRETKSIWVFNIFIVAQHDNVPFFFKQWGGSSKCKCHNAWGCRIFEGKTWDELPTIQLRNEVKQ